MYLKTILFAFSTLFIITSLFSQTTEPIEVLEGTIEEVDEPAQYPGGTAAFTNFLQENLVYPTKAILKNRQGKCYIGFIIDKDGNMSDFVVLKKVPKCPECDAEALRVLKLMPNWIPGTKNGKPVKCRFQVPINFKLT